MNFREGELKPNREYKPELFARIIDEETGTTEEERLQEVYKICNTKKGFCNKNKNRVEPENETLFQTAARLHFERNG